MTTSALVSGAPLADAKQEIAAAQQRLDTVTADELKAVAGMVCRYLTLVGGLEGKP